jgi:sporulation protein YlmC with PRC-barrel domain
MFLSQIIGKPVRKQNATYGNVTGICISLKSRALRYLVCVSNRDVKTEFAVSFSSVLEIDDEIVLSRLKPLLPQNCVKLTLNRPIYDEKGKYLGFLKDAEFENGYLISLLANDGKKYAATRILAVNDVVILRKNQPYPLGQRIPAMDVSIFNGNKPTTEKSGLITRSTLKNAIKNRSLIRFTLSLPPFSTPKNHPTEP